MATKEQELHQAVQLNDKEKVARLLDEGVSINAMFYGWTPLQLAIERGHEDIAVLLLDRSADFQRYDKKTKSPFEVAFLKKQAKVIERFLVHSANPNQTLSSGDSPLCTAVELSSPELVKVLLKGNANARSENKRKQTALFLACMEGETEIVKELLEAGALYNHVQIDDNNYTPLLAAAASDHEDIVKLLLKHKVDLDAQDSDGWTPLWHAYSNSSEEICEMLLKAGACTSITNKEGKTVIQEANENEDDDFIMMFSSYPKNRSKSPSNSPRR